MFATEENERDDTERRVGCSNFTEQGVCFKKKRGGLACLVRFPLMGFLVISKNL